MWNVADVGQGTPIFCVNGSDHSEACLHHAKRETTGAAEQIYGCWPTVHAERLHRVSDYKPVRMGEGFLC